jgi:hypothetical protein
MSSSCDLEKRLTLTNLYEYVKVKIYACYERGSELQKTKGRVFKLFRILKLLSDTLKNETNQNAKKSPLSDQNLER